MDMNAEALELLRQVAADTRATREAVEALAKQSADAPTPSQAIANALAEIKKATASAEYAALTARDEKQFERGFAEAQARIRAGARQVTAVLP